MKTTKTAFITKIKQQEKKIELIKHIYNTWNFDKEAGFFWDWKENNYYYQRGGNFKKSDVYKYLYERNNIVVEGAYYNAATKRFKKILLLKAEKI